jgi:predicted nicotinamide N-methyase
LLLDRSPRAIQAFILANTTPLPVPHCPTIQLYLAHEALALWQLTEAELEAQGLPLPFWAFAWAGGQGLARYVLDHGDVVSGKRVLDLASGSGLVGIAAKLSGAAYVMCADIDAFSIEAIALNAELNSVEVEATMTDLIDTQVDYDVILVGFMSVISPSLSSHGCKAFNKKVPTSWWAIQAALICLNRA